MSFLFMYDATASPTDEAMPNGGDTRSRVAAALGRAFPNARVEALVHGRRLQFRLTSKGQFAMAVDDGRRRTLDALRDPDGPLHGVPVEHLVGDQFRVEAPTGSEVIEIQLTPSVLLPSADRARGLMSGIAVGNLLGIRLEGKSRVTVASRFPHGVLDISAASGFPDDDDLAQSIVIAEAAIAGALDVDDLGRRFWVWAEANGAGMGGLTGRVLSLYGGDYPQRLARNRRAGDVREPRGLPIAKASKEAWGGHRAGNGALIRCAPLAIRWGNDALRLVRESIVSAVPTHWDVRCGWSCALANLAAASALRDQSWAPDALLELAVEGVKTAEAELPWYGYVAKVPPQVVEVVESAAESRDIRELPLDGPNMGFTLLTLRAALACYWHADSFEAGLRAIVEAGGDTDTNGAVAGAILGARFSRASIPSRWLRRVAEIRMGRVPMEWYADQLCAAAGATMSKGEP